MEADDAPLAFGLRGRLGVPGAASGFAAALTEKWPATSPEALASWRILTKRSVMARGVGRSRPAGQAAEMALVSIVMEGWVSSSLRRS